MSQRRSVACGGLPPNGGEMLTIRLRVGRNKNGIFDPRGRDQIKEDVAVGDREKRFGRDLLVQGAGIGQRAGLLARLDSVALASGTARAAASLSGRRRPRGTCRLGAIDAQRQHGHQDLDETLEVHDHLRAIRVPRAWFKSRENGLHPAAHGAARRGRFSLAADNGPARCHR